jgi:hypothetical protein
MAALLANVPASRLFDEMIKLLQTGHALASIEQLRKQGLHRGVFPVLDAVLAPAPPRDSARSSSPGAGRHRPPRRRGPAGGAQLHAGLHAVARRAGRWTSLRQAGEPPFPALQQAIDAVFDARIGDISGRGKLAADMREIWQMQPRFERRTASSALRRWWRSRAFAPATTSCACAPTRRGRRRTGRLVGGLPPGQRRRARGAVASAVRRNRRVRPAPMCLPQPLHRRMTNRPARRVGAGAGGASQAALQAMTEARLARPHEREGLRRPWR